MAACCSVLQQGASSQDVFAGVEPASKSSARTHSQCISDNHASPVQGMVQAYSQLGIRLLDWCRGGARPSTMCVYYRA